MRKHVLIIAEAGVNHNGDYELHKQLIETVAEPQFLKRFSKPGIYIYNSLQKLR